MTIASILVALLTAIMIYFLILNSFHAILLMFSVPELWSHWRLSDDEYFHALVGREALPPISIIASLQQTPIGVAETAAMLLALDYPRFEVVLVIDGTDGAALADLIAEYELYEVPPAFTINVKTQPVRSYYRSRTDPRLVCLDMPSTQLGDALNAALNASRYPHAVVAGPGVFFERDALLRLSRPFLLDRSVACSSGILRPARGAQFQNGVVARAADRGWINGCHSVEYLRMFVFQRLGWNRIASNIVVPSNPVMFKREHIFGAGGFDPNVELPGIDMAMRLPRYLTDNGVDATMPVIPDPVAWYVIDSDLVSVGRMRRSWVRGLIRGLGQSRDMLLNPEYGMFGMVALPYFWLGLIISPILEFLGYIALIVGLAAGMLDSSFIWAYLAAVVGYGILLSIWSVVFQAIFFPGKTSRRGTVRLLMFAVVESLGYRQVLLFFRTTAYFFDRQPGHDNGQPSPTGAA